MQIVEKALQFNFVFLMYNIWDRLIILQLIFSVFLFCESLLNCQCVVSVNPDQTLIRKEILLSSFLEIVPVVIQDTYNVRHWGFQDID